MKLMKLMTTAAMVIAVLTIAVACNSSNNGPVGGPITGALDTH